MCKSEWYMDLKSEPYMFISGPNICNMSPNKTNFMDNQLVKNRKGLKPLYISNTTQETNEE